MNFSNEILFFFSALGAFNGLLLGFYFLLFATPKHISNRFLGILLLVLSVRVGKSVFFYFNPDLSGIFLQIGITACFFIGPFLYFYIRSVQKPESNIHQNWKYHMMVLVPIILILGIKFPYIFHRDLWARYFMNMINLEWLAYLLFAGHTLLPLFEKIPSKKEKLSSIEIWVLNVFVGNVLIWIAYYSFHYTYYIVGALSFSFITYLLVLFFVFSKRKHSVLFKNAIKKADRKIDEEEAKKLFASLHKIMQEEELYKNPNLKSSEVAKRLHISVHQLSQLLNANLGKSFPMWVNEYRIGEAKKIIGSQNKFSLENVGYECGFNSKSTFYATFKKLSGTTPAKFKSSL